MRGIRKGILLVFCVAALFGLAARAVGLNIITAVLYLDGVEVSGSVDISAGRHTLTARADADIVCIAFYEQGRFVDASFSRRMEVEFPESGAEVALFCLDGQFRPIGEAVRVRQGSASQKLLYTGQAVCYDKYNEEEYQSFPDYTVRLNVVTEDGKILEVREIAGYELNTDRPTNDTNADFLVRAAKVIPGVIVRTQSASIADADAVTGATCSSEAIARAVENALKQTPEPYEESGGEVTEPIADGVYAGQAHCLGGYLNYMVDVDVTVKDGIVTEIRDRTLTTPMSSNDKILYSVAWRSVSKAIAKAGMKAEDYESVDGVTGATVSTAGINAAVKNALKTRNTAVEQSGEVYAPEGISLYARAYPVVTVRNGKIASLRIVPAGDTDTDALEVFSKEIVDRQSVSGLAWPEAVKDDAFSIANLTDQILYGTGVLP